MLYKILSPYNDEQTQHNINELIKCGVMINEIRIVPVVKEDNTHVKDLYLLICESSKEVLDNICKEYCLSYREEYEGAPLYL